MEEIERMTRDSLLQLFPVNRRTFWNKVASEQGCIEEIRLRAGRPILVKKSGKEWYLEYDGQFTDRQELACCINGDEMEEILQHICNYSLYAFADEVKHGFITVRGGHRVGVAGQVVMDTDGSVRILKNIRFMNIRISHQIKGVGNTVLPALYQNGTLKNTLIISPPGCGKTTLLRDLVRQISDGNAYHPGMSVGVVDERSELAGSYLGQPQNDVGIRTDVLDACPKALGIMMLLRSMAPAVIAVDELGKEEDFEALYMAASCGCKMIATIHGESPKDVVNKPGMKEFLEAGLFESFVILGKEQGKPAIRKIWGREEFCGEISGRSYDFGR